MRVDGGEQMIKNKSILDKFLMEYKNPKIIASSCIYEGFVDVIKPVPTICGAEVTCHPENIDEVKKIIKERNQ